MNKLFFMKFYNKLICILVIFFTGNLFAQFQPFSESTEKNFSDIDKFVRLNEPNEFRLYTFNLQNFLKWVKDAPELSNAPSDLIISLPDGNGNRSEERRVGKECGYRWWPYHREGIEVGM